MLNIKQIRLNNLETLIAEAGSATELARQAGTNSSYLSQVRNQLPTQQGTPRSIGDELARKLEGAMNKRQGWLDTPHIKDDAMHTEIAEPQRDYVARPLLPLISWDEVGDWHGKAAVDFSYGNEVFPSPVKCSPDSFVLRIQGSSMEPRFCQGDLIFVDPKAPAIHGKYVVVKLGPSNDIMFRQLIIEDGKRYLMALNPDWPERISRMDEDTTICGGVVFKGEVF